MKKNANCNKFHENFEDLKSKTRALLLCVGENIGKKTLTHQKIFYKMIPLTPFTFSLNLIFAE